MILRTERGHKVAQIGTCEIIYCHLVRNTPVSVVVAAAVVGLALTWTAYRKWCNMELGATGLPQWAQGAAAWAGRLRRARTRANALGEPRGH